MNTPEHVKALANIQPTVNDVGLTMTIAIVAYDGGIITVNGTPIGPQHGEVPPLRLIAEMFEELLVQRRKRLRQLAGDA